MWDLMGCDRSVNIGGLNKLFCKSASAAIVVADITDQMSLENTVNWKN